MAKTPSGIKYKTNFPRSTKEKKVDYEFGVKGGNTNWGTVRPVEKKKAGRKK